MKFATLLAALLLAVVPAPAQSVGYNVAGRAIASQYGLWQALSTSSIGAGLQTMQLDRCYVPAGLVSGKLFVPFATNAPVAISDQNSETVTPSAVSTPANGSTSCTITATFTKSHQATGAIVSSATFGLAEALNDVKANPSGGGLVTIDPFWMGSTAQITSLAAGSASVAIEDLRTGSTLYLWNGSAYAAATPVAGVNGTANHIVVTPGNTPVIDLANPLTLPTLQTAVSFDSDSARDLGSASARPRHNYALDQIVTRVRGGNTTTQNKLLTIDASGNCKQPTTGGTKILGIEDASTGSTGSCSAVVSGIHSCVFDNAVSYWDAVQANLSDGSCHDAGSSYPNNGNDVIGFVLGSGGAGTYSVYVNPTPNQVSGGGGAVGFNHINAVSCPSLDDQCFAGKMVDGARLELDPGVTLAFRLNQQVQVGSAKNIEVDCDQGSKITVAAPWTTSSLYLFQFLGSTNIKFINCEMAGLTYDGKFNFANGSATVSGVGTSIPASIASTANRPFIQVQPDGPFNHGAQINNQAGQNLTVQDCLPPFNAGVNNVNCQSTTAPWQGQSFTAGSYPNGVPATIVYGLAGALDINDVECPISSISSSGTTVTVSLVSACDIRNGGSVTLFNSNQYNISTPADQALPRTYGPITIVPVTGGTDRAVTSFTFPWPSDSTVPTGTVNGGSACSVGGPCVAVGANTVQCINCYLHDFTQQALNVITGTGPTSNLTSNAGIIGGTLKNCATTCANFQITDSPIASGVQCYNWSEASPTFESGCIGSNSGTNVFFKDNTINNHGNYNKCMTTVFSYGGTVTNNHCFGMLANNGSLLYSRANGTAYHFDTAYHLVFSGNTSLGFARGLLLEVGSYDNVANNDFVKSGNVGMSFGRRADVRILNDFDTATPGTAPSSFAIGFAGTGSNVTLTPTEVRWNNGGSIAACPAAAANVTCTQDTSNFKQGAAAMLVTVGATPVTGYLVGQDINNTTTDLHLNPTIGLRFGAGSSAITVGLLQLAFSQETNCNFANGGHPEIIFDVGRVAGSQWSKQTFITPALGNALNAPGIRSWCLLANGIASTSFDLDALTVDVGGVGNNIIGNRTYQSAEQGLMIYGGATYNTITGNTFIDAMWDKENFSRAVVFDPTLQIATQTANGGQNTVMAASPWMATLNNLFTGNTIIFTAGQMGSNAGVAIQFNNGGSSDTITQFTQVGSICKITTSPAHHQAYDSTVRILNATSAANNGTYTVTASPDTTHFWTMDAGCVTEAGGSAIAVAAVDSNTIFPNNIDPKSYLVTGGVSSKMLDLQNGTNYSPFPGMVNTVDAASAAGLAAKTLIEAYNVVSPQILGNFDNPVYRVNWYLASVATCATPGPGQEVLQINYTDPNGNARSVTSPAVPMGAVGNANVNSGTFTIEPQNNTRVTYQVNDTPCTTGNTSWRLRTQVENMQN